MDNNANQNSNMNPTNNHSNGKDDVMSAICFAIILIVIFSFGNFLGNMIIKGSGEITESESVNYESTAAEIEPYVEQTTAAPVVEQTVAAVTSSEAQTQAPTAAPTVAPTAELTVPTTEAKKEASSMSKAEIAEMFNTAANKIKPDATKITLNFKKQQHLSEYTELPSALQSLGSSLISSFLKDVNDPEVYDSKETINEKFPIKNQTWSGHVSESDLKEAACTDDGTYYNITLKFVDCTDPNGTSVANAFNIISAEDITSAASVVTGSTVKYFDAVINCKINKSTGRITWINYHLPIVLTAEAKVIVPLSGTVGMMFEEDYSIEY